MFPWQRGSTSKKQTFKTVQQGLRMFFILVSLLVPLAKLFAFVSKVSPKKSVFGCEGMLAGHRYVDAVYFSSPVNVGAFPSLPELQVVSKLFALCWQPACV